MDARTTRPQGQDLAARIAGSVSPAERDALSSWVSHLLQVRASSAPSFEKARSALAATMDRRLIWPALRTVAKEGRRLGWNERSAGARLGLAGAAAGIVLFGSPTATIAALGTAVGVPLWVVFGSGATFARALQQELELSGAPLSSTAYRVLDADKLP